MQILKIDVIFIIYSNLQDIIDDESDFINDLSNFSNNDDFDFVDSHLFINAVSFVNCFEAA